MRNHHRHQFWILSIAGVVLLSGLSATCLWDDDEALFAGTAAEMYGRQDLVVPKFNGELFAHEPPWMYWTIMTAYSLFGVTEFAARLFSAVFGIATAILVYHLGRRLFEARVGFLAGLILSTSLMFGAVARAATADSFLVFFVTLSLYLFTRTRLFGTQSDAAVPVKQNQDLIEQSDRWYAFVLMYAVMGLAVLVKGPIGVFFPMTVIAFYLVCRTPIRELGDDATRSQRVRETWSSPLAL